VIVPFDHLVASYGYVAVFAAIGLESLGVPAPGETTLIAAAVYAGATHRLSLLPLVLVAALGAVIGDNIGYVLGRTFGERLVLRTGRLLHIEGRKVETKLVVARYVFSRHGGKAVFLGRFVALLRTYAALLAGTSNMAWRRFLFCNASGGLVWAAIFGVGGYEFGGTMSRVGTAIAIVVASIAVSVAVVGYAAWRRYGAQIALRAGVANL
jgi:membrane protein DedA with SNARE-associated domain